MTWLKDKLKAAWAYSRTVFLNVVGVVVAAGAELTSYAMSLDWNTVFSSRVAFWIMAGVNILNIMLRFATKGPVGAK